jgi:rhomboid family GlyGly-CTERM serine protease
VKRFPWVTLAVASSALAAWWAPTLDYDRAAIARGEVWRLITGHLAHWTPQHLAWDVLAFLMLGAFCEAERGHRPVAVVILVAALGVSLFLFLCCPEVAEYRGLSAIDSTLWCWAALLIAPRSRLVAVLLVAVFIGKVLAELVTSVAVFAPLSGAVELLPVVHVVGAIVGAGAGVLRWSGPVAMRGLASS